jgi:hypothetical protein
MLENECFSPLELEIASVQFNLTKLPFSRFYDLLTLEPNVEDGDDPLVLCQLVLPTMSNEIGEHRKVSDCSGGEQTFLC